MSQPRENESLNLLTPAPESKLLSWVSEFYNKPVQITHREILRHRDLSYVERLFVKDSLPESIIYKLVLPPWDVERDLLEHVLIPSISSSAQLYLSAHHGPLTALFLEDLGSVSLQTNGTRDIATKLGEELAKLHRAYSYRCDELMQTLVLRTVFPLDYEEFTCTLAQRIAHWNLISNKQFHQLMQLAQCLALQLAGETISLVHGDFYAENVILRNGKLFIIDWSYFTIIGVPLMDLATLTMDHPKNAEFINFRNTVIEAYSYESGRDAQEIHRLLPYAETLSRLLFLSWLVDRKNLGIKGTTVGAVDGVIPKVVQELGERLVRISA